MDTFGRQTDSFGGSISADATRVTFPALSDGSGSEAGVLLQTLQMTYVQQVSRLLELGSSNIYYVGGRAMGNAAAARIFGPRILAAEFYRTYGNVCNAKTNTLHFGVQAGCNADSLQRRSYTCHFVVLTEMSLAAQATDSMINESLRMIFSSLLYG